MKTRTRRRVVRDPLPSEVCGSCGRPIPPRSLRPGAVLCARCRRGDDNRGFVVYRGSAPPLRRVPEPPSPPPPPREGPIWVLTDEQADRQAAYVDKFYQSIDEALAAGPPGKMPLKKPRRYGKGPKPPRDLVVRTQEAERTQRRLARGWAKRSRAELAQAQELIDRAHRRAAWRAVIRPASATDHQWLARTLIEGEGLTLREAGQRLGGISRVTVLKLARKAGYQGG